MHCAKIATQLRQQFNRDVVIDMVCYRRFGHNEGDEPSFTQPLMYKKIREHPTTLKIYGKKLIDDGLISQREQKNKKVEFKNSLNKEFIGAKDYKVKMKWFDGKSGLVDLSPEIGQDRRGVTGVDRDDLLSIGKK